MGKPNKPRRSPGRVHGMRDEGDLLNPPRPLIGKRDILGLVAAVVIIYVLLTTALLFVK